MLFSTQTPSENFFFDHIPPMTRYEWQLTRLPSYSFIHFGFCIDTSIAVGQQVVTANNQTGFVVGFTRKGTVIVKPTNVGDDWHELIEYVEMKPSGLYPYTRIGN